MPFSTCLCLLMSLQQIWVYLLHSFITAEGDLYNPIGVFIFFQSKREPNSHETRMVQTFNILCSLLTQVGKMKMSSWHPPKALDHPPCSSSLALKVTKKSWCLKPPVDIFEITSFSPKQPHRSEEHTWQFQVCLFSACLPVFKDGRAQCLIVTFLCCP